MHEIRFLEYVDRTCSIRCRKYSDIFQGYTTKDSHTQHPYLNIFNKNDFVVSRLRFLTLYVMVNKLIIVSEIDLCIKST
jgi:hypothetical protein